MDWQEVQQAEQLAAWADQIAYDLRIDAQIASNNADRYHDIAAAKRAEWNRRVNPV